MQNQRPLSELTKEEMQILTRNIVYSLSRNHALKQKYIRPITTSLKLNKCGSNPPQKQKLLKYPAFPLDDTLQKFLKSAKPFVSKCEFDELEEKIQEFQCHEGKELQELLVGVAESQNNWLAERWLRSAYLEYRDPVTVFSSPGMTCELQDFKSDLDMIKFAANGIYSNLMYKKIIDDNRLPILKMGKFELDNSQFFKIFGTCRIPGRETDRIEFHHKTSKHIIVMVKNHFFKLPVYNKCGEIIRVDFLVDALKRIWKKANDLGTGVPFGVLTADTRDNWAVAYDELMCIRGNGQFIRDIQQSLFIVCIDEPVPIESDVHEIISKQLLHGGGPCENSCNRWFDKCIQFIVNRNGITGFTYEHSSAEGGAIAQMTDNIQDFAKVGQGDKKGIPDGDVLNFSHLQIQTSSEIDKHIKTAKETVAKIAKELEMKVLHYKDYGKSEMKKFKVSPDSFIQMAMQLAYFRLHKKPGAHYESAHLRIFEGGRTETIRSCSEESIEFAKAFVGGANVKKQAELLRLAIGAHKAYAADALIGKGVDRHFLGLKLMARENNLPIPDFFDLSAVKRSSHFSLSTSQVPSKYVAFMCYGPIVENGYGICYNPRQNDIIFAISAWKPACETSVNDMANALCESLEQMKDVLEKEGECQEKPRSKL